MRERSLANLPQQGSANQGGMVLERTICRIDLAHGPDLGIRGQRHGRHLTGTMAFLAVSLKKWKDVAIKGRRSRYRETNCSYGCQMANSAPRFQYYSYIFPLDASAKSAHDEMVNSGGSQTMGENSTRSRDRSRRGPYRLGMGAERDLGPLGDHPLYGGSG